MEDGLYAVQRLGDRDLRIWESSPTAQTILSIKLNTEEIMKLELLAAQAEQLLESLLNNQVVLSLHAGVCILKVKSNTVKLYTELAELNKLNFDAVYKKLLNAEFCLACDGIFKGEPDV